MSQIEEEYTRKARQWLEFGDEDLRLAEHAFALSTSVPYRLIAYHAQQCAEKHLKAFLVFSRVDFSFTHNIGFLLEEITKFTSWQPHLDEAKSLTPFAITTRYPGLFDEVTPQEAREAVIIARVVRKAVRDEFAKEGFNLPNQDI